MINNFNTSSQPAESMLNGFDSAVKRSAMSEGLNFINQSTKDGKIFDQKLSFFNRYRALMVQANGVRCVTPKEWYRIDSNLVAILDRFLDICMTTFEWSDLVLCVRNSDTSAHVTKEILAAIPQIEAFVNFVDKGIYAKLAADKCPRMMKKVLEFYQNRGWRIAGPEPLPALDEFKLKAETLTHSLAVAMSAVTLVRISSTKDNYEIFRGDREILPDQIFTLKFDAADPSINWRESFNSFFPPSSCEAVVGRIASFDHSKLQEQLQKDNNNTNMNTKVPVPRAPQPQQNWGPPQPEIQQAAIPALRSLTRASQPQQWGPPPQVQTTQNPRQRQPQSPQPKTTRTWGQVTGAGAANGAGDTGSNSRFSNPSYQDVVDAAHDPDFQKFSKSVKNYREISNANSQASSAYGN